MAEDLKVLIVDDSRLVVTQLEHILAGVPGIDLVGKATDGAAAVRTAAFTKPDVVLMDIVMPGMDGLSALRIIRATRPKTRVVMISSVAGSGTNAEEAFRLGAVQMISKPFDPLQIEALLESELAHLREQAPEASEAPEAPEAAKATKADGDAA
jgi:YesN/AraC family two-component response regulator